MSHCLDPNQGWTRPECCRPPALSDPKEEQK